MGETSFRCPTGISRIPPARPALRAEKESPFQMGSTNAHSRPPGQAWEGKANVSGGVRGGLGWLDV